jgi:hypothetical protein
MKRINIVQIVALAFVLIGCEGKFEPTNSFDSVNLLLPLDNEQCFGTKLQTDKIRVEFDWDDINEITQYIINYTDGVTGESNSLTTSESYISIDLEPGTLYTWNVTVSNDFSNSKTSNEFSFYTEGLTNPNHVPFPADLEFIDNGNGTVDIFWQGLDLDDDIDFYQVFFSADTTPNEIFSSTNEISSTRDVVPGLTYYLVVLTFDENGNYSESKLNFIL